MTAYLLAFVAAFWPHLARSHYRMREVTAIAEDVASTDCGAAECLRLMNVAALESGFERSAIERAIDAIRGRR